MPRRRRKPPGRIVGRTLWKSEIKAREKLVELRLKMQARKNKKSPTPPPICRSSCLICGGGYENSISNVNQSTTTTKRSAEEILTAFTAFGKALLVPHLIMNAWDFNVEPLPLCPSCLPSLFRIAQLNEALERIQLEIQQKADSIREKIIESQNQINYETNHSEQPRPHAPVQVDDRISRFRLIVTGGRDLSEQTNFKREGADGTAVGLDEFGENDKYSPEEGNSCQSESDPSNESTDEAELDDEGRLRKKRARLLLERFKASQSSKRASSLAKLDDVTIRVLPRRKASLEFLKSRKSKRGSSDSDGSGSGSDDERKSARNSKSKKEKCRIAEPVDVVDPEFDPDPGLEKCESNFFVDAHGVRRRVRRVPEPDPIQFKEVNGQPVYREIPILKEAEGRFFNYTCTKCSKKYTRSRAIAKHIDNYFKPKVVKPYEMRDGKMYYKDVEVTEFENKSAFACTLCPYKVKSRLDVFMHIDKTHKGEFPFICEFCSKGFMKRRTIRDHIQFVHEGQRTSCDICGKPLKGPEMVKRHKWSHMSQEEIEAAVKAGGRRPLIYQYNAERYQTYVGKFDCPHCDRSYKSKYSLKDHIEITHFGKKIPCTRKGCDAEFKKRAELLLHYQDVHQEVRRDYACTQCNKTYPTQSQLKYHQLGAHSVGVKEFQCEVCSLDFARKCLLNIHMKSHSDVRDYQCDLCDKSYKGAHNLRKHREKHHTIKTSPSPPEVRPYECDLCDRAFKMAHNLENHVKNYHANE